MVNTNTRGHLLRLKRTLHGISCSATLGVSTGINSLRAAALSIHRSVLGPWVGRDDCERCMRVDINTLIGLFRELFLFHDERLHPVH